MAEDATAAANGTPWVSPVAATDSDTSGDHVGRTRWVALMRASSV